MNKNNFFKNIKTLEPDIKNSNYIKNNIILSNKLKKTKLFLENIFLCVIFIATLFLVTRNIVLEFYPGQDIYNSVSVNMLLPLCLISLFLAGIGSIIFEILQKKYKNLGGLK